jgi:hypothetical protein
VQRKAWSLSGPRKQKETRFYKERPKIKAKQDKFDVAVNMPTPGTGTWQVTPISEKERFLASHKVRLTQSGTLR